MKLEELLPLSLPIHVADIGAAAINEVPPYRGLIDRGLATLSAFDADPRAWDGIVALYGDKARVYSQAIADGAPHTLYIASPASGMTSLLKPSLAHQSFFNAFAAISKVQGEEPIQTTRLDDVEGLAPIDYLKMDVQGAELMILKHGLKALARCVVIQLEVSFITLYEDQPPFGEIDLWMRSNGFAPHCFVDVRRWSIAPTVRDKDVRVPFNQLLEADIVYVRDSVERDRLSDDQLAMMALITHYAYSSIDLAALALLELEQRGRIPAGSGAKYLAGLAGPANVIGRGRSSTDGPPLIAPTRR